MEVERPPIDPVVVGVGEVVPEGREPFGVDVEVPGVDAECDGVDCRALPVGRGSALVGSVEEHEHLGVAGDAVGDAEERARLIPTFTNCVAPRSLP